MTFKEPNQHVWSDLNRAERRRRDRSQLALIALMVFATVGIWIGIAVALWAA